MRNPYIAGHWVSGTEFYGRPTIVEDILHGPDDHLWVMGLRRTGKTSLLRQTELLSRQDDLYLPLFWDMQGCHTPDDFALALYEGVEEATACFAVLGMNVPAWEGQGLFALLGALARLAQEKGRCLLLLVDEAECLNYLARDLPHMLQRLRRVLQRGPHIRTVLASSKRLGALHELCRNWETSPFLHGFALHYLGGLESEESTALIRQHQAARPVRAAPDVVAQIRQLTGDHPYLLQLLCSRLFSEGSLRPVTDDDLAFVDAQMAGFLLNDFVALADPERAILRALSSGQHLPAGTDPAYLHGLTALGVLRYEGDGHAIGNAFFARWLREQADWGAKSEVSAEGTLVTYTQAGLDRLADHSIYQTGLCQLLERLGQGHPLYQEALVYQQRLDENIARSRRYGDTETRKADRSEIIDRLNALALSALGMSFKELCDLATSATG
jgi:hypothetical protein